MTTYTIRFSLINTETQALMPQSWRDLYKQLVILGIAKTEAPAVERVKNDGFIVLKLPDLSGDELLKVITMLCENPEVGAFKFTVNSSKMKPAPYMTGTVQVNEPSPFAGVLFIAPEPRKDEKNY